ncbi:MAG: hypothetical protein B6I24_09740 [Bacteroidetes bacterium 4572_128]|nr:MAG: hypothetical protein B6I24_09740 [Bacteroidetes bacterium 4572_128]
MLLEYIINKKFIGKSLDDKFLKIEINDYRFLTIDNVNKSSFFKRDEDKYISYKKIRKLDLINKTIQYGDFIIFKKEEEYQILKYGNELGDKIIPSDDFIVLRTIGGGYFKNFIYDIEGRLYFQNKLNELYKNNDYDNFVKEISNIDIPLLTDIKPDKNKEIPVNVRELPLDPSKIDVRTEQIAIDTIIKRIKRNAINLFTEFQRLQNLWDNDVKSKFIESLLVKFPVPSFYFDCSDNENWLVIDGLQRLSTLKQFVVDNTLTLRNLEFLTHLNGKKYKDLKISDQSIIEETNITTIQIQKNTPARVKYSLFERINKDGKPLKSQELRHAINSVNGGKPAKYVKKLAEEDIFKEIWGNRNKQRMQDRETVLSYVAFRITNYKEYDYSEKKEFLDEMMSEIYKKSKITLDKWLFDFIKSLITAKEIFGVKNVFKKEGKTNQLRFSNHLFEVWTYALSIISEEERQKLIEEKEFLKLSFEDDLLKKDIDFINAIDNNQYSKESVKIRFGKIIELINQIIK